MSRGRARIDEDFFTGKPFSAADLTRKVREVLDKDS
jgi:hypothetical protein